MADLSVPAASEMGKSGCSLSARRYGMPVRGIADVPGFLCLAPSSSHTTGVVPSEELSCVQQPFRGADVHEDENAEMRERRSLKMSAAF